MSTDNTITSYANQKDYILVTGGTGLVGSHLIKELVRQGRNVRALYRNTVPNSDVSAKVDWIQGDILDVLALDEAMIDVAQVYHCAAIVSFHSSSKQEMFKINVEGTANVVDACLRNSVSKLCYVSSVAALGKVTDNLEITETTKWVEKSGNSNYSRSKHGAEIEVWRGIGEGLKAVIINPSIILGSGDWSKGSSGIFKTAYNEFPWYTEGVTGFVDVVDVVNAMIGLMNTEVTAERFIISAENKRYKDIFSDIARCFGKKPPFKRVNRLMAEAVWRVEAVKSFLTGTKPLLTKETAFAAQAIVRFNNKKIKSFLPSFEYTPLDKTISRVCSELKTINKLA